MQESEQLELLYRDRPVMRPKAVTWLKHILLLVVTFCTATIAGSMFPFGPSNVLPEVADPTSFAELVHFIVTLPELYGVLLAGAISNLYLNPEILAYGLSFSTSLLFILISHEMGHYIACRVYRVDATLPFFLPTPPMVGPAGTFGAFIRILSPMPSRKAVFDIGVAGPLAGFLALIPVAAIGLATMEMATPEQLSEPAALTFADPLFMRILGSFFGKDPVVGIGNAFYFAAWVGLLVTALNLIPSGQLDGGHAVYAVFGERVHHFTGRIAFVCMAVISVLGLIFFNSPSGFLIAVILAVMMRVRHPQPWDQSPLDTKRKVIAALTLLVFILCFVPFPIRLN